VNDEFFDLTLEKIAARVFDNKKLIEQKIAKKNKSESKYYENKQIQFELKPEQN
jgi:hypothetical protein